MREESIIRATQVHSNGSDGMWYGGCEVRRMNPKAGQWRASPDAGQINGQDQIVQSVNYYLSSIRVASINEGWGKATERLP